MARTTEAEVRAILETNLTSPQIEAFMADATLWVTEELAGQGLTSERLALIEKYLVCALVRVRDVGLANANFDGLSESYQVDATVTDYLLRAAAFDPTGRVRQYFLAPKEARVVQWRVGKGFEDEDPPVE